VKIKLSVILLLVFISLLAHSQTPADSLKVKASDSTQIKLDEYKKLFDSGIIGEDEYNKMKSELLAPKQQQTGPSQIKTSDSTQVKLDQLKKLYETGVINEDEYNRTRAKLLGLPVPETRPEAKSEVFLSKTDTMSLTALRDRAKSKVIAGSVILSVGGGFIIGDILLASLSPKLNPTDSLYSDKKTTRTGSEAALGVLGGVASIGGAVFLALGLKDRAIYRRRNKELTMNFTGKEIEIAFVF
jgi:uncharacterized membrane protein